MTNQRRLIGLVGYAQVGKDTVAGLLAPDWKRIAFADACKADIAGVAKTAFGLDLSNPMDKEKLRPLLVTWGNLGRHCGDDYWIKRANIPETGSLVFTDIRYLPEAEWVYNNGGLIINIQKQGRGPANNDEVVKIAEILDKVPHTVCHNNGTIDELRLKITDLIGNWF